MEESSRQVPRVTIAIPTYNRAASYLPLCLQGALAQTYPNLEIVVADNGSTDDTRELVARYGDGRVRYFRHARNIPPNDNFNFCLQQARGDYFQLLQDDEQIDPDFVETCLSAAGYSSAFGLIQTGLRTIDARGHVIGECPERAAGGSLADLFLAWFEGRIMLYLCNTLFNRAALHAVGGFHSRHNLFQDVMAQVKVAARMPRVHVTAVKASTRQHGGQFTYAANVWRWCEDSLDLLDLMDSLAGNERVRDEGARFFARIGYSRASCIRSPLERLRAYAMVYRLFQGRCWPSPRMVFASTSAYRSLRQVKRRLLGLPAWID